MSQTWCIDGRHFTREQLDLYRAELSNKRGLSLSMEDDEKPEIEEKVVNIKTENIISEDVENRKEDERIQLEKEYLELKGKRAWSVPSLKTRYNEIKKVLKK